MNKKGSLRLLTTGLAAASLFLAYSSAYGAGCGPVQLMDKDGNPVLDSTTAYSPKMTCMNAAGACHTSDEYGTATTKDAIKTQGVVDGSGTIYWQTYAVTTSEHGAVVGRHSQQGRNEDYSIAMKKKFDDAFFTSSPGMFGKF